MKTTESRASRLVGVVLLALVAVWMGDAKAELRSDPAVAAKAGSAVEAQAPHAALQPLR